MNVNLKDAKSTFDEMLRNCKGLTTNDYLCLHHEDRLNINKIRKGNILRKPETATYDELLKFEKLTGHHRFTLYTDYKVGFLNISPTIVSDMLSDFQKKQEAEKKQLPATQN